ncbi:MAG TPA: hypothetical protein VEC93_24215, partial [Anaerolineae bacterium]|nr:hypothetical protein [Anaerolineae bacterium]
MAQRFQRGPPAVRHAKTDQFLREPGGDLKGLWCCSVELAQNFQSFVYSSPLVDDTGDSGGH